MALVVFEYVPLFVRVPAIVSVPPLLIFNVPVFPMLDVTVSAPEVPKVNDCPLFIITVAALFDTE